MHHSHSQQSASPVLTLLRPPEMAASATLPSQFPPDLCSILWGSSSELRRAFWFDSETGQKTGPRLRSRPTGLAPTSPSQPPKPAPQGGRTRPKPAPYNGPSSGFGPSGRRHPRRQSR
jgi:hypothetical protein